MARLSRLSLPGHAHWVSQQAHPAVRAFRDADDRAAYLAVLATNARQHEVKLHAFALATDEVHVLLTPVRAESVSRLMQQQGRLYVSAYHRRHGGQGTLWAGRFRCALVEPGSPLLQVMCLLDGWANAEPEPAQTSFSHRSTDARLQWLTDPPEYWALGNTPFERQALWRERIADGLPTATRQQLLLAARGGWAVGSEAYRRQVAEAASRPAAPRPRGRPLASTNH